VKGKEVVDKVTGLVFPMHRILPHGGRGRELTLLGVGPRRKNLFVVEVNVYAVGLYLETSLLGRLKAFRGKSSEALAKEVKYYATLMKEGSGLNRALYLIFARTVPAGKIVEALAAVDGVKKEVMADFKKSLLAAIGSSLKEKETLTLAWTVRKTCRESREGLARRILIDEFFLSCPLLCFFILSLGILLSHSSRTIDCLSLYEINLSKHFQAWSLLEVSSTSTLERNLSLPRPKRALPLWPPNT